MNQSSTCRGLVFTRPPSSSMNVLINRHKPPALVWSICTLLLPTTLQLTPVYSSFSPSVEVEFPMVPHPPNRWGTQPKIGVELIMCSLNMGQQLIQNFQVVTWGTLLGSENLYFTYNNGSLKKNRLWWQHLGNIIWNTYHSKLVQCGCTPYVANIGSQRRNYDWRASSPTCRYHALRCGLYSWYNFQVVKKIELHVVGRRV